MSADCNGVTWDDDAIFAAIADERRQLAHLLATLTPEQWETPSLCGEWTVRDVAGHLVMPLITPLRRVVWAMVRARGDFDRANLSVTAATVAAHGDELPTLLRDNAASRFTPPGHGPRAPLTDVLIHGEDIRRPLGLRRDLDPDRLALSLDFLSTPKAGAFTGSILRLSWVATDLDWADRHPDAPEVTGPGESILLARTGRSVAIADLSGAGVALLDPHRT